MYKKRDKNQLSFGEEFFLPFGGKLDKTNRWIVLSKIIPWDEIEEKYSKQFSHTGARAKDVRMALGSLIIKERLGLSDEETVEQIKENPYLQYFIGKKSFEEAAAFDSSMMVHFRKRFTKEVMEEINEIIIKKSKEDKDKPNDKGTGKQVEKTGEEIKEETKNQGTMAIDATCTPADISYPTDIGLLNEAREKTEKIIDTLWEKSENKGKKPRTYRKQARKEYLKISKNRKNSYETIRRGISKQLNYVERNIRIINRLMDELGELGIKGGRLKSFWVLQELYRQQEIMYREKKHSVEDRIVSISQPHVRPIVRGKKIANVEFGAKIEISVVEGYSHIEVISWDSFNEGLNLKERIEKYKERYGCYPKVVLADKIYRNRDNLKYCKERDIRLSGPKLGRKNEKTKREESKQIYEDSCARNVVEGKFGEGKRNYSLNRIMTKLKNTSETAIMLSFIVMNLEHRLRLLFVKILRYIFGEVEVEYWVKKVLEHENSDKKWVFQGL